MAQKSRTKAEFGDFQTPLGLAEEVCRKVRGIFKPPATVLEPTCGIGNFLLAANRCFDPGTALVGVEINRVYWETARAALDDLADPLRVRVLHEDFFQLDLRALLEPAQTPLLVLGNPPWVTNAELGSLGSENLPPKRNFQNLRGLEAITGSSNFDISEWMTIRLIEGLAGLDGIVALLLKSSVARKVLAHAWRSDLPLRDAAMYRIDAQKHFSASVDACLFVCRTDRAGDRRCPVYADIGGNERLGVVGMDDDGVLVADIDARRRTSMLAGTGDDEWRSGIKHDCAKVLELRADGSSLRNGLGELVDVEPEVLYPLLKSSHVAKGRLDSGRWLLVPQAETGQDTSILRVTSPKAWRYLNAHAEALDERRSIIYRNRPRFSIFGVGRYTFTQWKVAISGLYKSLDFLLVPPVQGRPVVFDDTVYLTPCGSEAEARLKATVLNSATAKEFLSSVVFWDAKRPVTAKVLRQLDLARLADALGEREASETWTASEGLRDDGQLTLAI